jgi:hypothetical protein
VPKRDADSRAGSSDLGNAVFPLPLKGSSGHEKIATSEHEALRGTSTDPPKKKLSWLTHRHDGNHRLCELFCDAIPVPRDTVSTVAVKIEAHRVELYAVSAREDPSHPLEDRRLQRKVGRLSPDRRQPRFWENPVVHPPGALAPICRSYEFGEEPIGSSDPAGCDVEPRMGVELDPLEARERFINGDFGDALEDRGLPAQVGGRRHTTNLPALCGCDMPGGGRQPTPRKTNDEANRVAVLSTHEACFS